MANRPLYKKFFSFVDDYEGGKILFPNPDIYNSYAHYMTTMAPLFPELFTYTNLDKTVREISTPSKQQFKDSYIPNMPYIPDGLTGNFNIILVGNNDDVHIGNDVVCHVVKTDMYGVYSDTNVVIGDNCEFDLVLNKAMPSVTIGKNFKCSEVFFNSLIELNFDTIHSTARISVSNMLLKRNYIEGFKTKELIIINCEFGKSLDDVEPFDLKDIENVTVFVKDPADKPNYSRIFPGAILLNG